MLLGYDAEFCESAEADDLCGCPSITVGYSP